MATQTAETASAEQAQPSLETMEKVIVCSSCKTNVAGATEVARFPCPQCSEEIVRCGKCRRIVAHYQCSCGFDGPN